MRAIKPLILAVAVELSALIALADAPIITTQPASAVVGLGQPASLSVTHIGTGPFGYQWLKDGVILSGKTSATLAYANFQFTNSGSYQVVITNADGLAISFPASLSLSNAPLRVWGRNLDGQFGNGTRVSTNRPIVTASNVVAMAGGYHHSLVVKADGTLWTMGWNLDGQLGNGTTTDSTVPIVVASNVVAAAGGDWHSLFLKADGTLWAMGNNDYGQLGNGTTDGSTVPIVVASNVVAVAGGSFHSLFIKADGTLWAMGDNYDGQLGNGTTVNAYWPVVAASNVVAVACGSYHSLFVKADRTLWGMGLNSYGQLGNGAAEHTATPVLVIGPYSPYYNMVAAVAAGGYHSLFVTTGGDLLAMGYNYFGQLGNGKTNVQPGALLLPLASKVVAVAGGNYHSLFVKADGTMWAMGWNHYGQLGNGGLTNNLWPVLVNGGGLMTAGLAKEPTANHSLAVQAAVTVVTPLANQTVSPGQPASFTASVASGDGPFTYQWQLNGTNLVAATNVSYAIASAAFTDAGNFTVLVTGLGGSASASATLTVIPNSPDYNRLSLTGPMTNGTVELFYVGIPYGNYVLEWTTNLTAPIDWLPLATNPANASGALVFTNWPDPTCNNFWRIHAAP